MTHPPSALVAPDVRVAWVDIAKGFCIGLVVMMHSTLGVGEALGGEGFLHPVIAFAKPFRVPAFFLLSGLFLARVIDRDWRSFADKRVLHFTYFYLLWLVLQSLTKFGQVSAGEGVAGFVRHLGGALVEPYASLWFIYLLAVFSVVTKVLRGLPPLVLLGAAAVLEIAPVQTSSTLVQEFCDRWVYFVAGFLLAPQIFRLVTRAVEHGRTTLLALMLWAVLNGLLAGAASGEEAPALLPVVSLALGLAGAAALAVIAAFLGRTPLASPFRYAGEHSIAIYLAFFLPMAAVRIALARSGVAIDIGLASLIVTAAAVTVPLALERLARPTPLRFLFERPGAFSLVRRPPISTLRPAE